MEEQKHAMDESVNHDSGDVLNPFPDWRKETMLSQGDYEWVAKILRAQRDEAIHVLHEHISYGEHGDSRARKFLEQQWVRWIVEHE